MTINLVSPLFPFPVIAQDLLLFGTQFVLNPFFFPLKKLDDSFVIQVQKFRKSRLHECWILNHKQKVCKKTQRREVVKIIDNFVGQIHRVISLNQVFKRKFQLTYIRQPISEEFRYYSISIYWKVLHSEIMKSGLCL